MLLRRDELSSLKSDNAWISSPLALRPGEVLFIPAGTIHAAKNVGSSNAAELATYIIEKGEPLISISK